MFDGVRAVALAIVLIDELDGFAASSGIVVMAATNRPDILDPALLRPGRFDRHVAVDQPDRAGRTKILAVHTKDKPRAPEVDLEHIARRTPGFTGATSPTSSTKQLSSASGADES